MNQVNVIVVPRPIQSPGLVAENIPPPADITVTYPQQNTIPIRDTAYDYRKSVLAIRHISQYVTLFDEREAERFYNQALIAINAQPIITPLIPQIQAQQIQNAINPLVAQLTQQTIQLQQIQIQISQNQTQIQNQFTQVQVNLTQMTQNQTQFQNQFNKFQVNLTQIQDTLIVSQQRFEALSNNSTINYATHELIPPRMLNKGPPPNDAPISLDAISNLLATGATSLLFKLETYYDLVHNGNIETRKTRIKKAYGIRLY